ncbi:MAG: AMP-binding protein, partial [Desulfarculus sp.]|nr:AMP-binding protein [Pseudomonadota bacterium]MBV1751158.1 AMP-binding protein [Desulfarculus sp.]
MRGIGFWLTKREEIAPDKEAVVDGGRRLSYRQLNRRVNRLARALQAQGLGQGDRLALLSYNSQEYIEVIMASAKLGLVLVPLNWRLTAAELTFQLGDSGVKTLIFDPDLQDLAQGILERMSFERLMVLGTEPRLEARPYETLLAEQGGEEPVVEQEITSEAPFIIMYTAGTTGKPKGAVLTQGNCLYNALSLQVDMEFTSSDRDLVALPMFHIGGIGLFTLPMLYVGGTVVVQRSFEPAQALDLL